MALFSRHAKKPKIQRVNRGSFWLKLRNRFKRPVGKASPSPIRKPAKANILRKFSFLKRIDPRIIRITLASLAFVLIAAAIYGIISGIRNPYFAVAQFSIIGNNSIAEDKIQAEIKEFQGQSLFLVSTQKIEQKIHKAYPNIYSLHVSKIFPNKIFIVITETEPKLVLINLNGAYLVDEDAKVIDILTQEKINYPQDRLEIAADLADESSPLVKNIFLEKFKSEHNLTTLPQDQQDVIIARDFIYANIPKAQKLAEYTKLRNDILNEINALTGNVLNKINISDYGFLPQVIYMDNTQFAKKDIIDKSRLELTLTVVKYFSSITRPVHITSRIEWQSQLRVVVKLSDGVKLIFGALRKPADQLEDYEIMTSYLKNKNQRFSQIDLSSKTIPVKY